MNSKETGSMARGVQAVDLSTEIKGLHYRLPNCIFNAAGARCTDGKELRALAKSRAGAVLTKSCTLEPRDGNPHPRYWAEAQSDPACGLTSLITTNSTGLANRGYQFYDLRANKELQRTLEQKTESSKTESSKPYIISVAGLTVEDNLQIIRDLCTSAPGIKACDGIELNLSCPNISGKSQLAYDISATEAFLDLLMRDHRFDWSLPEIPGLGLKLPAYLDSAQLGQMADLIKTYPVSWVTCINSPGNGLIVDPWTETARIKPRRGLGGIGGSVMKSLALGNVYQFSQEFGERIDVVGCGGVISEMDVFEHILVGAKAVQVGSYLQETGPEIFGNLEKGFRSLMEMKGYTKLEDFRGRLKPCAEVCAEVCTEVCTGVCTGPCTEKI